MKICGLFLSYIALVAVDEVRTQDEYCDPSLCNAGAKHIACRNNNQFQATCLDDGELVLIDDDMKEAILNEINKRRNFVADGAEAGFKPACRMAKMQWDDELAMLATLNVKRCLFKYDDCRNTPRFKFSGQSMSMFYTLEQTSFRSMMIKCIKIWYQQKDSCSMDYIEDYPAEYSGPNFGDFTLLVADRNTHIGCAASTYPAGDSRSFLFVCNYAVNNIITFPVYADCVVSACLCETGRDEQYDNLCTIEENFDVNKWVQYGENGESKPECKSSESEDTYEGSSELISDDNEYDDDEEETEVFTQLIGSNHEIIEFNFDANTTQYVLIAMNLNPNDTSTKRDDTELSGIIFEEDEEEEEEEEEEEYMLDQSGVAFVYGYW